jgi:hypothetical protein
MKRTSKRKLAAVAMIVVGIAGAVAAMTAVGAGTARRARHARLHVQALAIGPRDVVAAAAYLGLPAAQLGGQLEAGRSLAQIADSTPGKSAGDLVLTLASEKRSRLETLLGSLDKRVHAEVNRDRAAPALFGKRHRSAPAPVPAPAPDRLRTQAAAYLGMAPARLEAQLQSGQTLGQLADATAGKSAVGLVATIVLARRERLAEAVIAHRLTQSRAIAISARLVGRVTAAVNRRPTGP